jgi:hypothetical protein
MQSKISKSAIQKFNNKIKISIGVIIILIFVVIVLLMPIF